MTGPDTRRLVVPGLTLWLALSASEIVAAQEAGRVVGPRCAVAMTYMSAKGGYQISVDATGSTSGTSGVAPMVTVDVRDETGGRVGQRLTLDGSLVGTVTVGGPGMYRGTATVSTPRASEADTLGGEGTVTCEATVTVERAGDGKAVFFDVLGGKERRVRPVEDSDRAFAQCSPLVGLKVGVAKRFRNDWEVVGAIGAGVSLVTEYQPANQSALFADAEVNKYLAGGSFIGTGFSLWDLTRRDIWTLEWLLHFGLPLSKSVKYPVFFVGEGRLSLDHLDDIGNNYEVWAGVRVRIRR
jgi:hypothetical protein